MELMSPGSITLPEVRVALPETFTPSSGKYNGSRGFQLLI